MSGQAFTLRAFTPEERATIADVCREFERRHRVKVGHRFTSPDDVYLWITGPSRSVASGLYTALIDSAPGCVTTRYAIWLTLEGMWSV